MKKKLSPVHPDYGKEDLTAREFLIFTIVLLLGGFLFFTGIWYWINVLFIKK
jgi:hypothetical protein